MRLYQAAVAAGINERTCDQGFCLRTVRGWLEVPSLYPTAEAAWEALPEASRRIGMAPLGMPVWFRHRSLTLGAKRLDEGHVALSIGGGFVLSPDWPRAGLIGAVSTDEICSRWGLKLLGWSTEINGRKVA